MENKCTTEHTYRQEYSCLIINTYWTRPSPKSSLLCPERVILSEAKLICPGVTNWMLDGAELISILLYFTVKSRICTYERKAISETLNVCHPYDYIPLYNSRSLAFFTIRFSLYRSTFSNITPTILKSDELI